MHCVHLYICTASLSPLHDVNVNIFCLCCYSSNHQPVMVFEDDPYLSQSSDESFVDILTEGVRQGLFEDSDSDNANNGIG